MIKELSIILGFLLVSTILFCSVNAELQKDIIIVDDEGDGDYTSIKTAINHSKPGDTIEVYSGTYLEYYIQITQPNITLKGIPYEFGSGNDTGKPFLDGAGEIIFRIWGNASGTTITGFHMETNGTQGRGAITVYGVTNITFKDNYIHQMIGPNLLFTNCSYIQINNNSLGHSYWRQAIVFHDCNSFTIIGNEITNCLRGIDVWGSSNNIIKNNIITDCDEEGIFLSGFNNIIKNNHIQNNLFGIHITVPLNEISNNNFIDNEINAYFQLALTLFPYHNTWQNNYWGEPRLLPNLIFGFIHWFIPWVQFDWRPALQPHQIT